MEIGSLAGNIYMDMKEIKKVYVLWQYPKVLGIFSSVDKTIEAGETASKEKGFRKITDYWTTLPYWVNEGITISIDVVELDKLINIEALC